MERDSIGNIRKERRESKGWKAREKPACVLRLLVALLCPPPHEKCGRSPRLGCQGLGRHRHAGLYALAAPFGTARKVYDLTGRDAVHHPSRHFSVSHILLRIRPSPPGHASLPGGLRRVCNSPGIHFIRDGLPHS